MSRVLIHIYDWFEGHKRVFYAVLFAIVALCATMATQLSFQENITNFFDSDDKKSATFDNIEAADKIIVMLTGDDPDTIIASAEIFERELDVLLEKELIGSVTAYADEEVITQCTDFIYDHLPILLTDSDYEQLHQRITPERIESSVANVYSLMTSPSGMVIGDVVMQDPLNIATHLLQYFEQFNPDLQYEIYEGRLFTQDLSTMLMFIEPSFGMGDTGNNDSLVSGLESAERVAEQDGVEVECIGGPIYAVHNARQIKRDTATTLSLALVVILVVIGLSLRNKWSIPLIIIPPGFGMLFALAMVWLIQGEISAIAIGAGTVVLGISLSYSIHIVSHLNHISSPKEIIEELTTPLTIGCFTTIGAFAALLFTSSSLLQDMGLFAVFALIGTTIFCLIFLPHFLKVYSATTKSRLLMGIERIASYKYEGNKWVVLPIIATTVVALFFWQDVEFDDNMSNINFMPDHVAAADAHSSKIFSDSSNDVYIVTSNSDLDALIAEYDTLATLLNEYHEAGKVEDVITIRDFAISPTEQSLRLERWHSFWAEHRAEVMSHIDLAAQHHGFREDAFSRFEELISRQYAPCNYTSDEISDTPIISEWIGSKEGHTLLCRISIAEEHKTELYTKIEQLKNTAVIDRGYFSAKMVENTSNDLNYILFVSSLIVFLALLISYGRLELTLLTFLPMAISWVIILGMMALFDIKFNIVNIILATFIFGIGDDFSIFIMDGLLQEYKSGKQVLGAHKMAIFFSAFTAIVGMGVLIFAEHPALKSIALISMLGLSVVVLVSYTIQPMLFRLLVTAETRRGGFPYTLGNICDTVFYLTLFLVGCIVVQLYIIILLLLPIRRATKKEQLHKLLYHSTRAFLKSALIVKIVRQNPYNETFEKPAVIIANHQSLIDILLMLSTTPKIVMVTNSWVWRSPIFGWIVRYADFQHNADGYETLAERLRDHVDRGYSVVVFPEGTRSVDCRVQRFKKGAFYLAQLLKVDILPMVIYGTGHVASKQQGLQIRRGTMVIRTERRIAYGDSTFGVTYQEQAKSIRRWYIAALGELNSEYSRINDRYFRDAIIKNYIYKGPVLEWYMRVKCRLDGYYDLWDRLIPSDATITDVGCGYGQMSFMLGMLSHGRHVIGIDYDSDKIDVACNALLCHHADVRFECGDMRTITLPASDVILFNDSLHYIDSEAQRQVLTRAVNALTDRGFIIVRDGNASQGERHNKTKMTEVWSTKIMRFNKTSDELHFVDAEWMERFAHDNGLQIEVRQCDEDSSQTIYLLTK